MIVASLTWHLSMNQISDPLQYPFAAPPAFGTMIEVASGVYWLQMPLPMSLKYINLYLIEDDTSWVIVDTGIRGNETETLWKQIIGTQLGGKPVSKVICTHMHPDHTGQSGFLCETLRVPLYMSFGEYYQAKSMGMMFREGGNWAMSEYFVRAGIEPGFMDQMRQNRSNFAPQPEDHPLPPAFIRHVCLYSKGLRVLISGDQILPVITSNVSVHPTEPFANPMVGWLDSHVRFKELLPDDILVLPAHNLPFYGVQARLQQLIDHHEDRMLILEENCASPQVAIDLLPHLFARKLEGPSRFMALGECIAHLHCLMSRQRITRFQDGHVFKYQSIDPTLKDRARPGQHEPPDEVPQMV
jgi:glyoxylase-like metal-dependent hydrolase (beta-lactamase superfamily II)